MFRQNVYLCSLICAFSYIIVDAFNVDSHNYASYGGPGSSMFGFSIAVHKESNNGWLIVGAPEAQSGYQRRVYRGGSVYKCPIDRDGDCQEIPFDTRDDNVDVSGQQMDNKTEQWFGATVSSAGRESGPVVACAPRYTWYPRKKSRRDPVGTCYVSDGAFTRFNEYSPCRTFQWGYHRQGSCQAGFSAAINSEGNRLFIGSPGSWYWQGQMYSVDAHATFDFKPRFFSGTYGSEGQVHQQNLETRPAVFSTTEGTEKDDDSYMGYSTIVGDFIGNGEDGIAVGMPRGNDLKGKVLLFTWNLTNFLHHFSSDQLGSYYGYALAAADVDGDKKVDLIVGAPMYTLPNTEMKYDVGRVYVIYHNSNRGKFVATYVIDGFKSKSRFGQALASLGDINQDGYGDFAIGAPYDGPNERGAVYIYHGSSKGVRKKFSQVIYAEDVAAGPISGALNTFGFSLAGGLDLDGNEYPDMGVGAYLSNNAFFFRSRPVVRVDAQVKFLTPRKEVDIKTATYQLKQGGSATLTNIDFCVKYHGKGIPEHIDLDLQYVLDSKKPKNPRMGFVENENTNTLNDTIRLYKDKPETCVRKEVFVKSDIRDKLTPLVAEVNYWMQENSRESHYYQQTRNPRSQLRPILDLNSPPSRKDSISVHKECGDDNICIPDLNLSVKPNVDQYLLGSTDNLTFDIIVSNRGEDSFETILEVKYPKSVYYSHKNDRLESHVLCNTYENNILKCEIGNPISKNKVVRFSIFWQPDITEGMAPSYEFDLFVNSTNQELGVTQSDNKAHVSVAIWSNSTLDISGKSHPAEIYFNSSLYMEDINIMKQTHVPFERRLSEQAIGPQVTHVYYLRNEGPATIKEAEIFFVWPSLTLSGEDFLYLLEPPQFSPNENIQCDAIVANHLNFNIERSQKSIWERLRLDTADRFSNVSMTDQHISSVIGGGIARSQDDLNAEVGASGDASLIHQRRQNVTLFSNTSTIRYPSQVSTHSSSKNIKIVDGITHVLDNTSAIYNDSGSYIYQNQGYTTPNVYGSGYSTGNTYQHNLQNAGLGVTHSGSSDYYGAGETGSRKNYIYTNSSGSYIQQSGGVPTIYHTGTATQSSSGHYTGSHQSGGTDNYHNQRITHQGQNRSGTGSVYQTTHHISDGSSQGVTHSGISSGSGSAYQGTTHHINSGGYQGSISGGGSVHQSSHHISGAQGGSHSGSSSGGGSVYQTSHHISEGGSSQGMSHIESGSRGGSVYQSSKHINEGDLQDVSHSRSAAAAAAAAAADAAAAAAAARGSSGHQNPHYSGGGYQQVSKNSGSAIHTQIKGGKQNVVVTNYGEILNKPNEENDDYADYEDEDDEDQAISGYYDSKGNYISKTQTSTITGGSNVQQTTHNQEQVQIGGQRDPKTYGKYGSTNSQEYVGQVGIGDAALGKGFRVTTLDLGDVGSSHEHFQQTGINTQNVARLGHEGESGSSFSLRGRNNSGYGYTQSGGLYSTVSTISGEQTSSYSAGAGSSGAGGGGVVGVVSGNSGENIGGRTYWREEKHWSETKQIPATYYNNVERDNVPTDRPSYGRKKRQIFNPYPDIANRFPCNGVHCTYMRCVVQSFEKDKTISIALRSRINARVLRNVSATQSTTFSSIMAARISKLPYIGQPKEQELYFHEITSNVPASESEIKPDIVPLWVVVLSAVAGTIILLLVVFLLYKIGFFKRNRPSNAPERQPLNRNGYHHGDEAL